MSKYLKGLADKINGVGSQGFTQELDINLLVPSLNNFYGIREIEELANSIRENGLMHNLVTRKKNDGTYEIISGERRYHAAKSLGFKTLPCQVKEINDLDAEIILIQANVEQRELLPSEKMEGIKRLKAIYEQKKANGEEVPKGKLRDIIGQDMNLSGVQVGRYQKVDKDLIPDLKEKLDKEEITLTQAHTLSNLSESRLKSAFKEFVNPRLVISNSYVKGIINISNYSISDSILTVINEYEKSTTLTIKINSFEKCDEVEIEVGNPNPIKPKILYKISDGVFIWFKRNVLSFMDK